MKGKNWLLTHNNPEMTLEEYMNLWKPHVNYANMQLEKGDTVHIQAYISLKTEARMTGLKKKDGKAHFELVKKDNGASAYCLKEDTRIEGPIEYGTKPIARQDKTDWDKIKQLAKEGKVDEIPSDIYVRCYN